MASSSARVIKRAIASEDHGSCEPQKDWLVGVRGGKGGGCDEPYDQADE
ncbi:hypothetical protein PABG_04962 [Paracoccidioides brasiliensis Pb03]|nr:hypothetical protein PABG_04962 [Paracoccidioides brasiliensis Pb03]